ncbi:hypothetical protein [Spiroplasma chrysopicola]|uniref:Uncharacterized protein n=1 Tax=Spiroplasma chrysopicola DF-1 TaxID=1276227 RepID=R4U1Y1_9MOLU|nr:hypothetical protein [Spiroplasma chrysopicola]AGM25342.1 hypothetical protein SCHRY_v1c07660 [Spiroplasma chrysopicola DF-1]
MFARFTKDLLFYYKREEWKYQLNEDNVRFKPRFILYRYERKMGKENFNNFKFWIFKRWIIKNFAYTQEFIHRFYRLSRKLGLTLNQKEKEFIYNVEEVNFTLWRPLKELPIYYELEPKEKCHFKNNDVNIHQLTKDNEIKFICKGVLLITNKRIIIDGIKDNFETKKALEFDINTIEQVEDLDIGIKIVVNNKCYLLRENNNTLILALLYRSLGKKKVNFNYKKIPDNLNFLTKNNK